MVWPVLASLAAAAGLSVITTWKAGAGPGCA
jgi:hypothetical protein